MSLLLGNRNFMALVQDRESYLTPNSEPRILMQNGIWLGELAENKSLRPKLAPAPKEHTREHARWSNMTLNGK